jgi:SAM-dependent methyltransferase
MSLITEEYRALNAELHKSGKFGGSGYKHAAEIRKIIQAKGICSVLDYGCGQGTLAKELTGVDVRQYDPAIPKFSALPETADLVVCTDVLEHVEPDCLKWVLKHIEELAEKAIYLSIALRPDGKKILPDGRNPHLIVKPWEWWIETLGVYMDVDEFDPLGKTLTVWARPYD